ncbi:dimethylallyl tryptophan synthase [Trichophaea hybrida]|nr:dimethylallyl tryptophan synthase [Trichophaea hybrida]
MRSVSQERNMPGPAVEAVSRHGDYEDLHRILVLPPCPSASPPPSIHCDFPSIASTPLSWPSILTPYLSNALTHSGGYTASDISHHTTFFTAHVSRWLGPGPTASNNPGYSSAMTNDHTPFELSFSWKSARQNGTPIVRYVIDIFPPEPYSDRRGSLKRALDAIASLKTLATTEPRLQLSVFSELWTHVTHFFLDREAKLHPTPCASCAPSSTFMGFDLVAAQIKTKFYWLLPSCPSIPEQLVTIDALFTSCRSVDSFFASASFTAAWSQIREHVRAHANILQPRMLSIDATRWPAPRVKIYTRCVFPGSGNDFENIQPHLTLGGHVALESDFESTARALWEGLVQREGQRMSKYCLLLWDVGTEGTIDSKLYVMCQEIPRRDAVVAGQVLECCRIARGAGLLEAFAKKDNPSAFISEIGLAPRGAKTEVSVYASPCWFSRRLWKDREDVQVLMEKIRCPVRVGVEEV